MSLATILNRNIFAQIQQALKPTGKLFIQTFLAPVQKNAPSNEHFYLQSGELTNYFATSLTTEVYGEGWLDEQRFSWYIGQKK